MSLNVASPIPVVPLVNAYGLFTHKRQNLMNMIFGDLVVDVHYIDEGERDETNHGRSY